MILVRNIRLPLSAGEPQAFEKALREARIPRAKVQHLGVAKLSVDARRGQPKLVYTVAVTLKNEAEEPAFAGASANVSLHSRTDFRVQRGTQKLPHRPVVCGLGPAGLFAALLLAHPELKSKIARISLMGGGIATGNWTPAAEFNILVDPEAAKIVFTSGVPITMAGLDVTEKALILPEDFERVRALCNPVSDIVAQWLEFFYKFHRSIGYAGAPMHDPCAVMALIHPEIFTIRPMYVQIETAGEYCRGTTVGDLLGFSGHAPNADVLMGVDRDRFADLLVEAIKFYGEAGT